MEGTTGQKRRPKQTPKNIQTLERAAAHAGSSTASVQTKSQFFPIQTLYQDLAR